MSDVWYVKNILYNAINISVKHGDVWYMFTKKTGSTQQPIENNNERQNIYFAKQIGS